MSKGLEMSEPLLIFAPSLKQITMGQYYHPTILGKNKRTVLQWMYAHNYGNGLKLTEHSYIGNGFVSAFESLIKNNPQRVVWAGDYAEHCKDRKTNVYKRCNETNEVKPTATFSLAATRYVVNHTTKQFVDKCKSPRGKGSWNAFRMHPLPLLTCEGNGEGGGDCYKPNENIGIWARHLISVESKKPVGYTELIPNFEVE